MTQLMAMPEHAAAAEPFAIEVRGLTMSYGSRQVLRGVDFEVRPGEVFCLLGPNGAGKTTTVEILEGFRQRTGGDVRVLGVDPADQRARLRERIGIVLQECGFPRQARVAELIDIWRSYYPRRVRSPNCSRSSSSPRTERARCAGCPAGSAAGSTSHSPSRAIPTWCSSTSRRPGSTRSPAAGAGRPSRTCVRSARRSC